VVSVLLLLVAVTAGFWAFRSRRPAQKLLLFLGQTAVFAQGVTVVEDWSCGQVASISNSSPAVVTCDTPHNLPQFTVANQKWIFRLEGATGNWEKVNGQFAVELVDAKSFQIPVDTTNMGSFDSQRVFLYRGNHIEQDLARSFAGNGTNPYQPVSGALEVTVPPGYTTTVENLYCRLIPIKEFVVSAGEADITLTRALPNEVPSYVVQPGREVHFRFLSEPSLNSEKYRGINFPDRPHTVSAVSTDRLRLKAPVTVPDGVYTGTGTQVPQVVVCPQTSFTFLYIPRQPAAYPFPAGRVSNYVKNPPMNPEVNRMHLWLRFGKLVSRPKNGGYMATIGTYAKLPDDPDDRAEKYHFYHQISPNFYPGRWMQVVINETPQHHRSATGTASFPNRPMLTGWPHYSAPLWDGRQGNYLSNLTAFYVDTAFFAADFSGQKIQVGPITMDRVEGEPDGFVSSLTSVWAPERVDNRGPGYEVSFAAPKYSNDLFDIHYSTAGSLKTLGFSKGESGGQLRGSRDTVVSLIWHSPQMPEHPDLWVGIRPRMSILGVSSEGTSPIVVTTRAEPLLADLDQVNIEGVNGNKGVNVSNAAIRMRPARFWWLTTGLVNIEVSSKTATVRFSEPHNLVPGQVIEISGAINARLGRFPNQKLYTIQSVPDENTLTVRTPDVEDGMFDADASKGELLAVRSLPSFSIEGTSGATLPCPANSGLCTASGYVIAADDFRHFTEIHVTSGPGLAPSQPAASGRRTESGAKPSVPKHPR